MERASAFLLEILEGAGKILFLTFIGSTWVSHTTLVSRECGAWVGGGVQSSNEPISFPLTLRINRGRGVLRISWWGRSVDNQLQCLGCCLSCGWGLISDGDGECVVETAWWVTRGAADLSS